MATRDGTVGFAAGLMGQRLLLHVALVTCAGRMASLAPACTIAHARVVVHFLSSPRRRAGVTGLARHRTAGKQLRFRNVIGRLAGGGTSVMTAGAVGGYRKRAVVSLGTGPDGG